jgi:hypothetical protein
MAITPNTTFTSGQILTAQQQNNFPRGIMALQTANTSDGFSTEEVDITSTSFTAVANRYYRITYYEPYLFAISGNTNEIQMRIRLTNLTGAVLVQGASIGGAVFGTSQTVSVVTTLTAGSIVVVGTLACSTVSATAGRAATQLAYILVEDIGGA